jgi:hypothetical protein
MIDNFRNHSDDWSQVPPRDDIDMNYPKRALLGAPIRLDRYYTAQVYADDYVIRTQPQVSVGITYVLWLFFGLFGVHYFYMNKPGVGVLYLLTGGLLGVGWFIDLFTIKGQVERLNRRR